MQETTDSAAPLSKAAVKRGIHWLAAASGYSRVRAQSLCRARILTYHEIGSTAVSGEQLEAQLRFLRRNFEVVKLGVLCERHARRELRGREVALTFDDGVKSHHAVVYRLLKQLALPATFFVCPGLIQTRKWIWNQELRARLQSLEKPVFAGVAAELEAPSSSAEAFVAWAKGLDPASRDAAEAAIRGVTPTFEPSAFQCDLYDPLTWAELLEFDESLVTIGSHTMTHPVLTTISKEEVDRELLQSKQTLESKLDREIEYFCYPNGSQDAAVVRSVASIYRGAVTTKAGLLDRDASPFLMPRIGEEPTMPAFQWRLMRP